MLCFLARPRRLKGILLNNRDIHYNLFHTLPTSHRMEPIAGDEVKSVFIDSLHRGVTPEMLFTCFKKYNLKHIKMNKLHNPQKGHKSATLEFFS